MSFLDSHQRRELMKVLLASPHVLDILNVDLSCWRFKALAQSYQEERQQSLSMVESLLRWRKALMSRPKIHCQNSMIIKVVERKDHDRYFQTSVVRPRVLLIWQKTNYRSLQFQQISQNLKNWWIKLTHEWRFWPINNNLWRLTSQTSRYRQLNYKRNLQRMKGV